jgi:putative peptidoglycan lipid II flippase
LNYAFRILYLPIGLFGVSIASASLPLISQHAAREDTEAVRRTVAHAMRLMLTLTVPASAGLLALAVPIVRVIFERGQFLPSDTQAAALALMAYAPGLVGYSAVKVLSPTFYALRDSRTPVVISVTAVLMNAALSLAFVGRLGYVGLALGTALASLLNAGLLLVLLRRRIGGIEARRLASTFVRIGIASAVMAGAAWGTHALLEARVVPGPGLVAQVVRVASAIGVALVVLVLAARALRIQEFDEAAGRLLRRLRGRGKTSTRGDA